MGNSFSLLLNVHVLNNFFLKKRTLSIEKERLKSCGTESLNSGLLEIKCPHRIVGFHDPGIEKREKSPGAGGQGYVSFTHPAHT